MGVKLMDEPLERLLIKYLGGVVDFHRSVDPEKRRILNVSLPNIVMMIRGITPMRESDAIPIFRVLQALGETRSGQGTEKRKQVLICRGCSLVNRRPLGKRAASGIG